VTRILETGGLPIRPTRAIVDLDAIETNVRALRSVLRSGCELLAVVKADGYGHGAPWIARVALDAGATALGVATVDEGVSLRQAGITAPILLIGAIDLLEAPRACAADLHITVGEEALLSAVQQAARSLNNAEVTVHIKVDTGLHRYGAAPDLALELVRRVAEDGHLRLGGISTHFASADEADDEFSIEQLGVLNKVMENIDALGIPRPATHVANSAGTIRGLGIDCSFVRAGIALYGVPPSDEVPLLPGMRPALSVESRITRVVALAAGDAVGYNRTFAAERTMRAVLVPIGYGDGYRRGLAHQAWVGIAGLRAHLLGRVSMDQIVVEVPDGLAVTVGNPVCILSTRGDEAAPTVTDLAVMLGTNTYEILVGLRARVPRVYLRDGQIIAIRTSSMTWSYNQG
jgi:alanine racemase